VFVVSFYLMSFLQVFLIRPLASRLSDSDTTLVHKNIASRKHNICYEAKLLSVYGATKGKPRKVMCYVGPKQVSIREGREFNCAKC